MSNSLNYQANGNHSINKYDCIRPMPKETVYNLINNLNQLLVVRNSVIREFQSFEKHSPKPFNLKRLVNKIEYALNLRTVINEKDKGARIAVDNLYNLVNNESDELRIEKLQEELSQIRSELQTCLTKTPTLNKFS